MGQMRKYWREKDKKRHTKKNPKKGRDVETLTKTEQSLAKRTLCILQKKLHCIRAVIYYYYSCRN